MQQPISRRRFVALTATGIATAPLAMMARPIGGGVSAKEVVDRIKKNLGVEWKQETVDGFKAGDPSIAVTGIATTSLATLTVLDRAIKAGVNLIVTSEPTYYSRADSPTPPVGRWGSGAPPPSTPLPADPVFAGKDEFIKKHNLAVFRMSDHWRLRTPDPFAQGLADMLSWSKFVAVGDPKHVSIPETSLDALVSHVKTALKSRGGIRVVGNPHQRIRKVAFLPGSTPIQASIETLPGVDAIVAGEVREWETVEYVRDTVTLDGKKSLVLVGRVVSEDPGMHLCAQWLQTIVPEANSMWISAGDPYWRPTA
jgi:putative NIF3 family GTP cyclohydrolase 1 type 2